jgi:hypothetical protein
MNIARYVSALRGAMDELNRICEELDPVIPREVVANCAGPENTSWQFEG